MSQEHAVLKQRDVSRFVRFIEIISLSLFLCLSSYCSSVLAHSVVFSSLSIQFYVLFFSDSYTVSSFLITHHIYVLHPPFPLFSFILHSYTVLFCASFVVESYTIIHTWDIFHFWLDLLFHQPAKLHVIS